MDHNISTGLGYLHQELTDLRMAAQAAADSLDELATRRLVSLSNIKHPSYGPITLAACSDGSVWVNDGGAGDEWAERRPIPGTRRARELEPSI